MRGDKRDDMITPDNFVPATASSLTSSESHERFQELRPASKAWCYRQLLMIVQQARQCSKENFIINSVFYRNTKID